MTERQPNILHIFADQMRAMEMSCCGCTNVATPAMDRLASEGARFTRMYTTSPVCCPARSSMMTGLLPSKTGVWKNGLRMREDVCCIAELTREADYSTGHIGKWHLDGSGGEEYDYVPPERHRGFGYWAGFEHGHRYWQARYFTDSPEPISFAEGVYEPDGQTDLAIRFIEDNRAGPWHLDLSWGPPHFPFDQEKPEDRAAMDATSIVLRKNVPGNVTKEAVSLSRSYLAMIRNLDCNLGRILDVLDTTNQTEDTIVVFTSDHGDMLLSHGQHYKRRPQEESTLVPFLIRFPRRIRSGQTVTTLASLADTVPTLLDLAGVDHGAMDGKSHADALTGEGPAPQRDSIVIHGDWLGCRDYDPGGRIMSPWRAARTERHKAVFLKQSETKAALIQLFDLEQDPFEMNNLASDPQCEQVRLKHTEMLRSWIDATDDQQFTGLSLEAENLDAGHTQS